MFDNINYTPTNYSCQSVVSAAVVTPDILFVTSNPGREVIKITHTGELYWNNRLVETDEDFKASMLDLAEHFKRQW